MDQTSLHWLTASVKQTIANQSIIYLICACLKTNKFQDKKQTICLPPDCEHRAIKTLLKTIIHGYKI